jgi:F-type H+-transporting ATPase subunit gamma
MAKNTKIIKKRISSVKNTKKITKTMEMISTAKSKKAQDRVKASQPYNRKIKEIIGNLSEAVESPDSPLLQKRDNPKKSLVFSIVSNRGLCGAYNTNVLKMAKAKFLELQKEGKQVQMHAVGKKGISFFKFNNIPITQAYTNIDDKLTFEEFEKIPQKIMDMYIKGEIDEFFIVFTKYHSSSNQKTTIEKLLPFSINEDTEPFAAEGPETAVIANYIFEPQAKQILDSILPYAFKMNFFQYVLESITSEHIARRIAMKSATDSATEMIKSLTLVYNRARQAKITQEIAEIVGGASALE